MPRISLILISGFFGAGKTTLLRRMLADPLWRARRSAFLVNDFADVDVDARVLRGESTANITVAQLSSGCMCCTAKGEFEHALRDLISLQPEAIVIETAGVTDPSTVMAALRQPQLRLDSIVCVIDAARFAEYARLSAAVEFQVYTADVVLLNKADEVTPSQLAAAEARVRQFNRASAILLSVRCDVPLSALFGAHAASADAELAQRLSVLPGGHGQMQTITVPIEQALDEGALTAFFKSTALRGVLRAKGFVRIAGRPRALLNYVPRRYSLEEAVADAGDTFVLFIGQAMNAQALEQIGRLT